MKNKFDQYNDLICKTYVKMVNAKNGQKITIAKICETAKISRTTFYNHYSSVEEITNDVISIVNRPFLQYIEETKKRLQDKAPEISIEDFQKEISKDFIPKHLEKIKENKEFIKCIYEKHNLFPLEETDKLIYQCFCEPYLDYLNVSKEDDEIIFMFYFSGISSLIYIWVKNSCEESIDEIIDKIKRCMNTKLNLF